MSLRGTKQSHAIQGGPAQFAIAALRSQWHGYCEALNPTRHLHFSGITLVDTRRPVFWRSISSFMP